MVRNFTILILVLFFGMALKSSFAQGLSIEDFNQKRCPSIYSCVELKEYGEKLFSLNINPGEERAELRDPSVIAEGDAAKFQVDIRVPEKTDVNTDGGSMVILQYKAENQLSPPMAFRLKNDGTMAITIRHGMDESGVPVSEADGNGIEQTLYRKPLAKGVWHRFKIRVVSGVEGGLRVEQDGKNIVKYEGPLGYASTNNYIKFGPYDYSRTQRSRFEIQYKNYRLK